MISIITIIIIIIIIIIIKLLFYFGVQKIDLVIHMRCEILAKVHCVCQSCHCCFI